MRNYLNLRPLLKRGSAHMRKNAVILHKKRVQILTNCNKGWKNSLKQTKKGVAQRCTTPFFHCQRKYINSLFTNQKTIEKQGKNGYPKVPVWVKIAGQNSVLFTKFKNSSYLGRLGRKNMVKRTKNKRKTRQNLLILTDFWSEWQDLNLRPLPPQGSALPTAPHPDTILLLSFLLRMKLTLKIINAGVEKCKSFLLKNKCISHRAFILYH